MGIEDWFPQYPLFTVTVRSFLVPPRIVLAAFLYNPRRLYPELLHESGESCNNLSRSVGNPADVFHTVAAIPVADHGAEYVPAFLTGQQPVIAVLCTVVAHRTRLLFQPRLNLLPDCFFNDDRIEILAAKPVRFVDGSRFAAEIFPAVIDQRTSPLRGSSCCLRVGFRPPPRMTF